MTELQHAAPPDRIFDNYAEFYRDSAYADFEQEHRAGGSFGLHMIDVYQDPIDFIDPSVPEFVFVGLRTDAKEVQLDFGDGANTFTDNLAEGLVVVPAGIESRHKAVEPHRVTIATVPVEQTRTLLEGAELGVDVFSAYYAKLVPAREQLRLLDAMWRVSERGNAFSNLYLDGLTLQFLASVAGRGELSPIAPDRPEDVRIARVVDYIEAHLGEAMTVVDLASVACLSPGHFSRTFKATIGVPVWSYVQRRRLERARDMLLSSRKSIAQIAYACGFASQAHLTKSFGEAFRQTPGSFRTSHT